MLSTQSIKFGIKYPKVAATELFRYYKLRQDNPFDESGMNIHNEDWDILIILDACRYDAFVDRAEIDGELSAKRSRGSTSQEWLRGNFGDDQYGDLVVVSANPFYKKLADEVGIQVHHFEWVEPTDSETGLTPPQKVTDAVMKMAEEYPYKRILAHYMQPHAPYIGKSGDTIQYDFTQLQRAIKDDSVRKSEIKEAYYENLDIVLEAIRPIITENFGKTVISSDHGEMLGEPLLSIAEIFSFYGHPYGIDKECVRTVPWFVVNQGESTRREIRSEEANSIAHEDRGAQLRALGYLE